MKLWIETGKAEKFLMNLKSMEEKVSVKLFQEP